MMKAVDFLLFVFSWTPIVVIGFFLLLYVVFQLSKAITVGIYQGRQFVERKNNERSGSEKGSDFHSKTMD